MADDIFFEIQLMSFFWILRRSKNININWVDWCKGCCLGCCLVINIDSGSVRVVRIGQFYAKGVSVLRCYGTKTKREINYSESLLLSRSTASSIVSSDDVYSSDDHEAHGRGLRMVTSSISCFDREFKLQVVRKSRSRTLWLSDCRKKSSAIVVSGSSGSSCLTSEGSLCLSGGSSSLVSSSRSMVSSSRSVVSSSRSMVSSSRSMVSSSRSMVSSSRSPILNVLAYIGCASEVRIRELLGDSPDTSKALRMLLRKGEVRRSGAGGRSDPFIYQFYKAIHVIVKS
ncbi:hypothetical protein CTI12_AA486070 [Artemisia annua]|uniref:HTH three-helical bundle domain-containing protein n=1 Tax=Artemisia annua TaxID=35608 RepID=A0A2U1LKA5_ARTAN|nr:hypothetical protein CTI12_AA486070 [Artemisia annua]